jgi:hypothetical protein
MVAMFRKRTIALLLGALVVGIADASALARTKSKTGEQEFSYVTGVLDDDCTMKDETDPDSTLTSTCWWQHAKIIYRFLIPLRARLRGFSVHYYGRNYGSTTGCLLLDTWATRYRRRVSVHFSHHGADGNGNPCNMTQVAISYRVPI